MPSIIYVVEVCHKDCMWFTFNKAFYSKKVADAYCEYKNEMKWDEEEHWRVVEEEVL